MLTGKIACANVLSDLYAMGVIDCDNMLMLLGVSTKMTEKERDVVIPLIMRGFKVSYPNTGQQLNNKFSIKDIPVLCTSQVHKKILNRC